MNRTNITRIELTLDEVRTALLKLVLSTGEYEQLKNTQLNQIAVSIIPRDNDDRLLVQKVVFTVYENEIERKKVDKND